MRTAVLGLGRMGQAVATRLLAAGHGVAVWNRTPGRAGAVVAAGAHEAASIADAVRGVDGVLLSLTDDAAVREVVVGPHGVRAAALDGAALVVDTSTVSPATSREIAAALGDRLVAAPILGAPQAVATGGATVLLGGPRDVVDRLEPLWSALSSTRRYCGPEPAHATSVKLLCNYLLMAGIAALSEAVAAGQAVGLGDAFLRDLFAHVPLVAPALQNQLDDVLAGDHRGWFTTRLGAKDVRLTAEMAAAAGVRLPLAEVVRLRYEEAAASGWGDADIGAVVELLRAGSAAGGHASALGDV